MPNRSNIMCQLVDLKARCESMQIDVQIFPGMEVYADPDLIDALDKGVKGITPILAHPERNAEVQDDAGVLKRLVRRGVLVQVNAGSVLGHYGPHAQRAAVKLLKAGCVAFLGSDMHSARAPGDIIARAWERILAILGQELADKVAFANGVAILEGREAAVTAEPLAPQRQLSAAKLMPDLYRSTLFFNFIKRRR